MVLTRAEVERLLAGITGTRWLIASLLYGSGLRVMECLRLRVKDVDFGTHSIFVRGGKGNKDRGTLFPASAREASNIVRTRWSSSLPRSSVRRSPGA